jgi:hypothetical protein
MLVEWVDNNTLIMSYSKYQFLQRFFKLTISSLVSLEVLYLLLNYQLITINNGIGLVLSRS